MNLTAIRAGLAAALGTIDGLRVAADPADQVNPPQASIDGPDPIIYAEDFEGGHHLTFTVRVFVQRNVTRSAQAALDGYMGDATGSLYAALEADKTLGGTVSSAQVATAQNTGNVTDGEVTYAVVDFTVNVMT